MRGNCAALAPNTPDCTKPAVDDSWLCCAYTSNACGCCCPPPHQTSALHACSHRTPHPRRCHLVPDAMSVPGA
eukprot:933856-Rhodomonas_salina.4